MRRQNNGTAVPGKHHVHVPRTNEIVLNVLQHVQTNHAVHGLSKLLEILGSHRVARMNLYVRSMP
jgi:hypothetical protein